MPWLYRITSGRLHNSAGVLVGVGYSGHTHGLLCSKIADPNHGQGCNDPSKISVHDVGPIPVGWYTIGPGQNTSHGPMTLALTPDRDNQMFGRSAFLIHGDLVAAPGAKGASLGCIIQAFLVRKAVNDSTDKRLQVVVE